MNAAKLSFKNKKFIKSSVKCGCYYCCKVFNKNDIVSWTDDGQTALCPKCGIDSVLADTTGLPVDDVEYLKLQHARWFK